MPVQKQIESQIDKQIGEVRTEALDLSFGEIANLKRTNELIIQPEYQRLFRWSVEQRSRLIESILLELPIPQIFVIENADGVYELIDGLQRISSVLQFVEPSAIESESFTLEGCEIIKELNGNSYEDLPLSLKLRLKRSTIRTIVIKRQSKSFLRYEMFKRLNTGGSLLSPQEIRNCSVRMLGDEGANFYEFIMELASLSSFQTATSTLPQEDLDQKANEELVLRYLATKNARHLYRGNVRDWLDGYMEGILLGKIEFDREKEKAEFVRIFGLIASKLGETAFVKFRGTNPIGGLAPAYFEAISMGATNAIGAMEAKEGSKLKDAAMRLVQSDEFRAVTGPGANNRTKLNGRIELATNALAGA